MPGHWSSSPRQWSEHRDWQSARRACTMLLGTRCHYEGCSFTGLRIGLDFCASLPTQSILWFWDSNFWDINGIIYLIAYRCSQLQGDDPPGHPKAAFKIKVLGPCMGCNSLPVPFHVKPGRSHLPAWDRTPHLPLPATSTVSDKNQQRNRFVLKAE